MNYGSLSREAYKVESEPLLTSSSPNEDRVEVSILCGARRRQLVITCGSVLCAITVAVVLALYLPKFKTESCKPLAPGMPNVLDVYNSTAYGFSCRWNRPAFPNVSVAGYNVSLEDQKGQEIKFLVTDKEMYSFTELEPWKVYSVKVAAYTTSDPCVTGAVYGPVQKASSRTSMVAPSAPSSVQIKEVTSNSVQLKWEKPNSPNGPLTGYVVNNLNLSPSPDIRVTNTGYIFQDLTLWTNYTFTIRAFNVFQGSSLIGPSVIIAAQTAPLPPTPPTNLKVIIVTSNLVELTWGKPDFPNGPLSGYVVNNLNLSPSPDIRVTDTDYKFPDLKVWTNYTFSVRAYNNFQGASFVGPSVTVEAQTDALAPSAPTNPKIKKVTSSSIELSWEEPHSPNGPLSGYILNNLNLSPSPDIKVTSRDFTFQDLEVWTKYTFTVRAFNVFKGSTLVGPLVTIGAQTGGLPPPYSQGKMTVQSASVDSASLVIPIGLFSSASGPIVEYVLLVERKQNESMSWHQGFEKLDESGFLTWNQTQGTNQWYRTSPVNWNYETDTGLCKIGDKGTQVCSIGVQKSCGSTVNYCNGPLRSNSQYWAKLRAYTDFGWTETFPVTFTTAVIPGGGMRNSKPSAMAAILVLFALLRTTVICDNLL